MGEETEFKNWWRKRFKGWSETHEPRASIGQGFPDVTVLDRKSGLLMPIEFKIGRLGLRDGCTTLLDVEFEPAQPSWHIRFQRAGGRALICVGTRSDNKGWLPWRVIPGDWMMEWERGIPAECITSWTLWE